MEELKNKYLAKLNKAELLNAYAKMINSPDVEREEYVKMDLYSDFLLDLCREDVLVLSTKTTERYRGIDVTYNKSVII